jgi:hypothetical protein
MQNGLGLKNNSVVELLLLQQLFSLYLGLRVRDGIDRGFEIEI